MNRTPPGLTLPTEASKREPFNATVVVPMRCGGTLRVTVHGEDHNSNGDLLGRTAQALRAAEAMFDHNFTTFLPARATIDFQPRPDSEGGDQ